MPDDAPPPDQNKYAPETSHAEATRQMRHRTANGIPVEEGAGVAAAELTGKLDPGEAADAQANKGSG